MEDMKKLLDANTSNVDLDAAIARLDDTIAKMSERLEQNDASSKKFANTSLSIRKKMTATLIAASVFLLSLTLCTYAYFTSSAILGGNQIASGRASVTLYNVTDTSSLPDSGIEDGSGGIPILPGYRVEKDVYAKNTGGVPVYIRAKIASVITLDERYSDCQDQIDMSLVSYDIDYENWTEQDGYYYYNTPLGALDSTTNLLSAVIFSESMGNIYKDSTIKVTILLETVQANGNGNSVFDASGWVSAEEGGAS